MNILIVDHDLSVAEEISQCLRDWGHRSEIYSYGKKALARIRDKFFDLVILEIFMPDLQADELIPRMKQMRPNVKIVFLPSIPNLCL